MRQLNIIAPTIKTGGGKELLLYLVEYVQKEYPEVQVTLFANNAICNEIQTSNIKIIQVNRIVDVIKLHGKPLSNALYFGNLPPYRKTKNSAVFFHNRYLLLSFKEVCSLPNNNIINKFKDIIRQIYIKLFIKNVSFVACQNKTVQKQFITKYGYKNVKVMPFFRVCPKPRSQMEKNFDFCYISIAHPHKNHLNLLKALELLALDGLALSIALTIEKNRSDLIEKIEKINEIGNVKIENFGVVSKHEVCKIYKKSRCLIFPSTSESFGLPLVEASLLGLDIIASDLPFTFEVIEPTDTFDPGSFEDIAETIRKYLKNSKSASQKKSTSKVNNNIEKLIESVMR
ncbi:mannosyltransferase B [Hydrogenimonas sp.]|nr:mannosyltransferase B [Hydrogenimonas sp.]